MFKIDYASEEAYYKKQQTWVSAKSYYWRKKQLLISFLSRIAIYQSIWTGDANKAFSGKKKIRKLHGSEA